MSLASPRDVVWTESNKILNTGFKVPHRTVLNVDDDARSRLPLARWCRNNFSETFFKWVDWLSIAHHFMELVWLYKSWFKIYILRELECRACDTKLTAGLSEMKRHNESAVQKKRMLSFSKQQSLSNWIRPSNEERWAWPKSLICWNKIRCTAVWTCHIYEISWSEKLIA